MADQPEIYELDKSGLSVVDRVLILFTKTVGEVDEYADIAQRLRETLIDKRDMTEAALERALFQVEQS